MKKCPYCGHTFNFIQFVTGYGSDTLFKHPAKAHPHEHLCLNCHKMLWIHYDRSFFERRFRQSFSLYVLFSAAITFFGVKTALAFSMTQAVLFMVIVILMGGVILKAYIRYESAALNPEKNV